MPKKAKKSDAKGKNSTARKQKKTSSTPPDQAQTTSQPPGSNKFVQDLLARGEAAELTEDGKLPLRATHIIQKNPDGTVELKRARFKLF